jgi:hypothetical protein
VGVLAGCRTERGGCLHPARPAMCSTQRRRASRSSTATGSRPA